MRRCSHNEHTIGTIAIWPPLQLDIEYGGDILESYEVSTLDHDEPWLMFSRSGRLVKEDVLDHANLWLVLPREARILPERIVG